MQVANVFEQLVRIFNWFYAVNSTTEFLFELADSLSRSNWQWIGRQLQLGGRYGLSTRRNRSTQHTRYPRCTRSTRSTRHILHLQHTRSTRHARCTRYPRRTRSAWHTWRTRVYLGPLYDCLHQAPITRSLQLPHTPVTAFSQTDLFLVWIYLEFRFQREPQWPIANTITD